MTAQMSTRRALVVLAAAAAVAVAAPVSDAAAQGAASKATNVAVTTPGTVQGLTDAQCKLFKGWLIDHIKSVGRQNLSDEFVAAMGDFALKKDCTAPVSIPVFGGTRKDIDVFNSISSIMRTTQGIDLRALGVNPVLRTASLQ